MARIPQGILGGGSGKVGPTVMSSWKGIPVLKAMPLSVANPKSPGQTTQRNKFSMASKWGSALLVGCIKPLWDRFAQKESGYNAWMKRNTETFNPAGSTPYGDIIMSSGVLAGLNELEYEAIEPLEITFSWLASTTGDFFTTDLVTFVIYCANLDQFVVVPSIVPRSALTYTLALPATFGEETVQAWVCVKKADGTKVSDSQYLGAITIVA